MNKAFVLVALVAAMSMPIAASAASSDESPSKQSSVFADTGRMIVAGVWTCEAVSNMSGAVGVGVGPVRSVAARTALNYCYAYAMPGERCAVVSCNDD